MFRRFDDVTTVPHVFRVLWCVDTRRASSVVWWRRRNNFRKKKLQCSCSGHHFLMTVVVHLVLDSRCCWPSTTAVVFQRFMTIIDYVKLFYRKYNFIITYRIKNMQHFLPNLHHSVKSSFLSWFREKSCISDKSVACCCKTAREQQMALTVSAVVNDKIHDSSDVSWCPIRATILHGKTVLVRVCFKVSVRNCSLCTAHTGRCTNRHKT